jgi:hypothetical protein
LNTLQYRTDAKSTAKTFSVDIYEKRQGPTESKVNKTGSTNKIHYSANALRLVLCRTGSGERLERLERMTQLLISLSTCAIGSKYSLSRLCISLHLTRHDSHGFPASWDAIRKCAPSCSTLYLLDSSSRDISIHRSTDMGEAKCHANVENLDVCLSLGVSFSLCCLALQVSQKHPAQLSL